MLIAAILLFSGVRQDRRSGRDHELYRLEQVAFSQVRENKMKRTLIMALPQDTLWFLTMSILAEDFKQAHWP
ncbi:hypothetical protein ACVIIV_003376 [Bradyrhizobium sp. USDA 4354]